MNKTFGYYLKKLPSYCLLRIWFILAPLLPDAIYLRVLFRLKMGYWMNLNNPETFNEKIQWLKLYDHRSEYTTMVDKYSTKEYVVKIIGKEYIIPTLGVWERPEDIEWEKLPNQFVLKTTHGGGSTGVVICKEKCTFNRVEAIKKLQKSLKTDTYKLLREWPYKNVPRRILAEKYMADGNECLEDYKVHCFNGIPRFILLCRDRNKKSGMTDDFYSTTWEHIEVKRPGHTNPGGKKRPEELELLLSLSKKLSYNIPFIRIDFYIINHRVYFGELTFYPASGLSKFEPESYDRLFGSWMNINDNQ